MNKLPNLPSPDKHEQGVENLSGMSVPHRQASDNYTCTNASRNQHDAMNGLSLQEPTSRRTFIKQTLAGMAASTLILLKKPLGAEDNMGLETAVAPPDFYKQSDKQAVVNVTNPRYGAVGDGETNNRAAFQAAIHRAIADQMPLFIPTSKAPYLIELDAEHPQLDIDGDLIIYGATKQTTTIQFRLQQPVDEQEYAGFYIWNGVNCEIYNLRLEEVQRIPDIRFFGILIEPGIQAHQCVVAEVNIDGFHHCIHVPSGSAGSIGGLSLTLQGCDIHPGYQYGLSFFTDEEGHKRLLMVDCFLHDNQFSHLVYCHPHNSVHVENCRFDGATGWAWQFQGSAVGNGAEYHRFVGCWFGPNNSRGIITYAGATPVIKGCSFYSSSAIQIRSDTTVENCYFTKPVDAHSEQAFIGAYSGSEWRATITNCNFASQNPSLVYIDMRLNNITATINQCQFFNQRASGSLVAFGGDSSYSIQNSLFYSKPGDDAQCNAIRLEGGEVEIGNCRFEGRFTHDVGVLFFTAAKDNPSEDALVNVEHCIFNNITRGSIVQIAEGAEGRWRGKLSGSNNIIRGYASPQPIFDSVEPVNGRFLPNPGLSPDPIYAGSVTVINSNYDIHHVNGFTEIDTLNWWEKDGHSNNLFQGRITLIANAPFSISTKGNIQPTHSETENDSRMLAVADKVVLEYDSKQDLWYEVDVADEQQTINK